MQGSFDGDSLKVAELLYKSGFKEAYAIKDGVRGKKGWLVCNFSFHATLLLLNLGFLVSYVAVIA